MSFSVFVALAALALLAFEGIMYCKTKNVTYLLVGLFVLAMNLPNFISLIVY